MVNSLYMYYIIDCVIPAKKSMCWKCIGIFGFRPKFNKNDSGYTFAARPIAAQIWIKLESNPRYINFVTNKNGHLFRHRKHARTYKTRWN